MNRIFSLLKSLIAQIWKKLPPPPPPEPPDPEPTPPPPPPLPLRERVLDMANFWLPGPVSDTVAIAYMQAVKDLGYVGVICGTQVPSVCNQQIRAAHAVGLWVDVYHYVVWHNSMLNQVAQIIDAIGGEHIGVVWIDAEDDPPSNWTPFDVNSAISVMAESLWAQNYTSGIYTRASWWVQFTGNTSGFRHMLLWCTEYDLAPPYDFAWWSTHSFGKWPAPTWIQFKADQNIAGLNVDLNENYLP